MSVPGPGLVLAGRYRLLDQVAVGAMGEVWRAHDDTLDRDVAVKVLRPELADDAVFLERFRGEARHAASVRHPHVAAVHDYGEDEAPTPEGSVAYLVMDLLEGRTLGDLLAERGPLPATEVAGLLAQVADALAAAHRIGLVHRDVKPANLVECDGHVSVTDFGIARAADAVPVTRTGLVMGTAEYLSPEQARGRRATTRSDVYSLGVVAYELLTGDPPFTAANPAEVARAHVHDPVPPLPDDGPRAVPAGMRATVLRCLAKDPAERPDVAALAERLRALGRGEGLDAPGEGSWAEPAGVPDAREERAAAQVPATAPAGRAPLRPTVPVAVQDGTAPARGTAPGRGAGGERPGPVGVGRPAGRGTGAGYPPVAHRVVPRAPRRRRRALRPPLVALLALVALLLLVALLQALGLLGRGGDAGDTDAVAARAGGPDVTRSTLLADHEDGR
ncbi:serine/threonine-protein kinase [Aquipuribacter sp. SD81]|uniref:serine/threonine-protein kinase n=1 Tax=Aquipuribacter sp. SD81 TaxID=3127703 RepID=UPI00301A0302